MLPEVATVCAELALREPIFHHPELGTTRADFEAQTVEDFWEVGASGTVYRREQIWDILAARYADPRHDDSWAASDFLCRELGPGTYLLDQAGRITRRATVWRRGAQTWQIVYHHGTVVSEA